MLTFEQMKELVELVARHRLSGVEIERSGFRLRIDGYPSAEAAPASPAALSQLGSAAAALAPPAPTTQMQARDQGSASTGAAAAAAGIGAGGGMPGALGGPLGSAAPPPGLPIHAGEAGSPAAGAASRSGAAAPGLHVLSSPIVGTFYRAPSPEAPSFAEVGARVRRGQVLCIIEAMKLMNEIECDVDGTVVEIYPQNAQAVEFGEPLFGIKLA